MRVPRECRTALFALAKKRRSDQGLSEKATNRMRFSRQTSSSRANDVSRGISPMCFSRLTKLFLWVPHPSVIRVRFFFLSPTAVIPRPFVAQAPPAVISGQRDLRLLSAKAHTLAQPQPSQNPHLHKNTGGVHAKDFYVEPRPLARHSALLMLGCGRLHSGAEHRSLREIPITAK
jgi:hypothetical protein